MVKSLTIASTFPLVSITKGSPSSTGPPSGPKTECPAPKRSGRPRPSHTNSKRISAMAISMMTIKPLRSTQTMFWIWRLEMGWPLQVKLKPAQTKPPCGINPIVRDLENHVAAVRRIALPRTLLCSPGLGAEASTSRKHTDGNRVFRVCGYKCIACTVAFVYTQALLAPLLNNSPNNSANFQKRSTN